ncbi:MAG: hypothetical protein ITG02_02390 [Patulibacter sp.]|nr:hypothetical protein [Patulibacter sp.]
MQVTDEHRQPYVLLDQAADDMCEESGWVETSVSIDEARDLLARYCHDEDGNEGHRPAGSPRRVWLAPIQDPDDECATWRDADRFTPGAREFWQLSAYDADLAEAATPEGPDV